MAASLGEKLRLAREAKGMELRDVADNTRIALEYLKSIEEDNYKSLPGGIFNKGFVRSFAKIVGVDEKEALADYNNLMAQQGTVTTIPDDEPISHRNRPVTYDAPSGSPFMRIFLALFVLGLVGAGIYFGLQYWQNRGGANSLSTATTSTANSNASASVGSTPTPVASPPSATDGLKVQVKATTQIVNITPVVDGKQQSSVNLQPGENREFTAQQSINIQYARSLAPTLEMTINNRAATIKTVSDNPKRRNSIEMQITRENFAQYLKQ